MKNKDSREMLNTKFMEISSMSFSDIKLLKKNPYCDIYQAKSSDELVIVKQYALQHQNLLIDEAKSIKLYHETINDRWLDCRVLESFPQYGILIMSFVPGISLSQFIYRSDKTQKEQMLENIFSLGKLLRLLYSSTETVGSIDNFFYEYIEYCQQKLGEVHGIRKYLVQRYKIKKVPSIKTSTISFSHGDFVPANIHISDSSVGLIDFANSNHRGHIINDLINFTIAINNMFISKKWKKHILNAIHEGVGELAISPQVKNIFYAFHYYRWLMLNINSKSPFALVNVWQNAQRFSWI
ncbi:phosphotransferase [Candidatus Uabimicrobium sp. HlEnr_7]|uniref:phosphotransferase n=1 Tax=Candidatus Uabimicrobium helgolandensis TaxID=3095367 RepID=UPI0035575E33